MSATPESVTKLPVALPPLRYRIVVALKQRERAKPPGFARDLLYTAAQLIGGKKFVRLEAAENLLQQGCTAARTRQWAEAEKLIGDALDRLPDYAEAYFALAQILFKQGKWWQAVDELKTATRLDDTKADWFFLLGEAEENMNRFEDATASFQHAVALDPEKAQWHYRLGYVLEKSGRAEEAQKAYAEVLKRTTDRVLKRLGVGVLHARRKDWDRAVAAFEVTAAKKPSAEISYQLGIACQQRYDWAGAERHFRTANAADFTHPKWHYRLGFALERQEKWAEAAASYQSAVERSNRHMPGWYYRLGYTLERAGRAEEAEQAFRSSRVHQRPHGAPLKTYHKDARLKGNMAYVEYLETLPIQPRTIFYESNLAGSVSCNPYAILRYLLADPRYRDWKHIYALKDFETIPDALRRVSNLIFVKRDSNLYRRHLATASHLINNSTFPPYFIRRPEQKYLNTWHGTPLKAMGRDINIPGEFLSHANTARNFLHTTHLISPNEHTTDILIGRYDIAGTFTGRVAVTGYPRIDATLKATDEQKAALRKQLGLAADRPVVLYAPTWRGTMQTPEVDTARLVRDLGAMAAAGGQLLFRGHHYSEAALAETEIPATVVPRDIDTYDLLAIVDVLVTDYSSIFFDFLATGRPVLHFVYDWKDYKETRGGLYLKKKELPGVVCNKRDELVEALTRTLADLSAPLPPNYEPARLKFCPREDGQATRRVVEFFLDDSPECAVPLKPDNRKSILIYGGSFNPNGITSSFINLLTALDKTRYRVTVVVEAGTIAKDPERLEKFSQVAHQVAVLCRVGPLMPSPEEKAVLDRFENKLSLPSAPLWALHDSAYLREFRRLFGWGHWDAVVNFDGYARYWVSLLGASGPHASRRSLFLHNDMFEEWTAKHPRLEAVFRLFNHFDAVVSVSQAISDLNRENLSARFDVPRDIFCPCPNSIDGARIIQRASEPLEADLEEWFSKGGPVFLNIGRFSPEKDQTKLLRAFAQLRRSHPKARLLIVGSGPLRRTLESEIAALDLGSSVLLAGQRINPFPILKRADCFVLSSNHEGQPMVLLEAMTLNKPIVATDIEGNRGVLQDRYGLLVENSDAGLADGMKRLLDGAKMSTQFDWTEYRAMALATFLRVTHGGDGSS